MLEIRNEFKKYIFISIISYIFIFLTIIFLVEIFKLDPLLSSLISYGIVYIFDYQITVKFVFRSKSSFQKILKYLFYLLFFYFLTNFCYKFILLLKINYIISLIINILFIFPLKFLVSKYLVYK